MLCDRFVMSVPGGDDYAAASDLRHHHHHQPHQPHQHHQHQHQPQHQHQQHLPPHSHLLQHHPHLDLGSGTAPPFVPPPIHLTANARSMSPHNPSATGATAEDYERNLPGSAVASAQPMSSPSSSQPAPNQPITPQLPSTEHMAQFLKGHPTAERFLLDVACLRELLCDLDVRDMGVYAKGSLRRGTRFGPFRMNPCREPSDRHLAWEVVTGSSYNCWLEPVSQVATWLRKIRAANEDDGDEANIRGFIMGGWLWYETNRDINAGEEIIFDGRPKTPYTMNGTNAGAFAPAVSSLPSDDRSDRDNGSLYSGDDRRNNDLSDDENNFDLRCEHCDKVFPDLEILDSHLVDAHHLKQGQYPCDQCQLRFSQRILVIRHEGIDHNTKRKYSCENCSRVFCDPSNLQRHIRAHHVGARSHPCPECGKTFATSSGLKQHQHIHSSVKPFACEVCFKAYTQFSNLCRHKRMHADCRMQSICKKCGHSFSTTASLSKHKKFCESTGNFHSQPRQQQQQQQQQLQQLQQGRRVHPSAASGATNELQHPAAQAATNAMATPPFLAYPFPAFPPYSLPGIFPESALQAANFPLHNWLFPKPLDMAHLQHLNPPANSPFRSQLPFGAGLPPSMEAAAAAAAAASAADVDEKPKVELKRESKTEAKLLKSESQLNVSDDNSNSMTIDLKVETKKLKKEEGEATDASQEQQQAEDDRKSIDIVTTPPHEQELNSFYAAGMDAPDDKRQTTELPLDLSISRKRRSSASSHSQQLSISSPESQHMEREVAEVKLPKLPKLQSSGESSTSHQSYKGSSPTPTASPGLTPSPSPPSMGGELSCMSDSALNASAAAAAAAAFPGLHCPPFLLEGICRGFSPSSFPFLGQMGGRQDFKAATAMSSPSKVLNVHHLATSNNSRHLPFPPESSFHEALHAVGLRSSVLVAAQVSSAHVGKIKDRYTCKFCSKVFPRSANLTRHLRTHTGEQPYTCKYCDRAFSISSNLQRHVRNIHNKERPFRCSLCDRCFGQQTNLDRHLKKHEVDATGAFGYHDSPSSNEADNEEGMYDEMRTFMSQVCRPSLGRTDCDTEEYADSDDRLSVSTLQSATLDLTSIKEVANGNHNNNNNNNNNNSTSSNSNNNNNNNSSSRNSTTSELIAVST
ncbi:transcription factor hamlet [Scaptodrosophila lebanonensis]|uniref:Transcription factor hamlet n=1 Tax=Drosophila lebanonensis TaxID=7225 RepID=A0A6J2U7D4_DROLE|nr:transcription factor hamlet [Scaptodrosophila lebanonensis]